MSSDRIRYLVRYTGRVQGVGFRITAVSQAAGLDVHGFVRNEHDGSVRMDVEGSPQAVKQLLRRIETAMEGYINETTIDERPPSGRDGGFRVHH